MTSEHRTTNRKPKGWCGTKYSYNPDEDDQAPADGKMAVFREGQRYYPCATQNGLMPTFGMPPNVSSGSGGHGDALMLGNKELIPRWKTSTASPAKLLYFVVKDGFKDEDFKYTALSFQQAADEWNALAFGVTISATTERAKANFLVKFFKPEVDKGTLASAFFPNEVDDVRVYEKTLVESFWRGVLKNSFLHEIGHIIGLRHEFANDPNPDKNNQPFETPAQRFGSVNPHSVMSYDDVNFINDMDKKDVKDFYKLAEKTLINGVPVTDYPPKVLQQK